MMNTPTVHSFCAVLLHRLYKSNRNPSTNPQHQERSWRGSLSISIIGQSSASYFTTASLERTVLDHSGCATDSLSQLLGLPVPWRSPIDDEIHLAPVNHRSNFSTSLHNKTSPFHDDSKQSHGTPRKQRQQQQRTRISQITTLQSGPVRH